MHVPGLSAWARNAVAASALLRGEVAKGCGPSMLDSDGDAGSGAGA
jgi:hypothetical protein